MKELAFVRWLGPLGGADGRFATASRKLAQENPRAFVVPTLVWLVVNALLATYLVASVHGVTQKLVAASMPNAQYALETPSGYIGGLYTGIAVLLLLMGAVQWFVLGWMARWRLVRLRARGIPLPLEPGVLTMTPGIWAALTAAHVVAAALLIIQGFDLHFGGLVFARHMVLLGIILAFSALIQALAAYYRQPFMVFWRTMTFPVAALLILMFGVIAIISLERYKEEARARFLIQEGLPYAARVPGSQPHYHAGLARSARPDAATDH